MPVDVSDYLWEAEWVGNRQLDGADQEPHHGGTHAVIGRSPDKLTLCTIPVGPLKMDGELAASLAAKLNA